MDERRTGGTGEASTGAAEGSIEPTEEQLQALLGGDMEGPLHFVNLLRFREIALYPPDHPLAGDQLSGADAYNLYGAVALEHVIRRGGRLVTLNRVEQQLIGVSRVWHQVATMEYRNVDAFIDMVSDPEYQQALVHRDAGLEATEVYVSRPLIDKPLG
jgi:uncharacterized protein (DUF1330 family)